MTETKDSIIINHIPSLTWNRLQVNHAKADLSADHILNTADDKENVGPSDHENAAADGNRSGEYASAAGKSFTPKPSCADTCKCKMSDKSFAEINIDKIVKETMGTMDAGKWADGFSDGIRRESVMAGKNAIYQEQAFATALGGEFTEFADNKAAETVIYKIPEKCKLNEPVILKYSLEEDTENITQRIIHVGRDSQAVVIIVHASGMSKGALMADVTKVILEEGAYLKLVDVELLGRDTVAFDDMGAVLRKNSRLDVIQILLGGSRVYTGCYADQCGEGSTFNIKCGYFVSQKNILDINYVAAQRGRHTLSDIYAAGALKDGAVKTLKGTIDFRKGSKGSKGEEREDVLVLSPSVTNRSVPIVLTEEDDVEGHHGATIGNLSKDVLFYLGSRGMSKEYAELLMIKGKILSIANMIPDTETVKRITCAVGEAFGSND